MEDKYAVIFANGELHFPKKIREIAEGADLVVAADGGLRHLFELGLTPHLLIGDLDSVTTDEVDRARSLGCEVRQFPEEKDETDLELALLATAAAGYTRILILSALGGRLDQTLANIYLLNMPQLDRIDVRIDDGKTEVILFCAAVELKGTPGDTVSLLPLSPIVSGITTGGLKYPLTNESLVFFQSRGVSNVLLGTQARVSLESGILLCIHIRQQEEEE